MSFRYANHIILIGLVSTMIYSLYSINNIDTICSATNNPKNILCFTLTSLIFFVFFAGCIVSSFIVRNNEFWFDKYCGIAFLLMVGLILLATNFTVFTKQKMLGYVSGTKFSKNGVIMLLGIGSMTFGFIDNFGMKLGTDALNVGFVQKLLTQLDFDPDFLKYRDYDIENARIMNKWSEYDWKQVINKIIIFRADIMKHSNLQEIANIINCFDCEPLFIPPQLLKDENKTNAYTRYLIGKYENATETKSMIGNSFSNFCAGLLGAGYVALFTIMTSYDNFDIGDNTLHQEYDDFVTKLSPLIEAISVFIGSLLPIILVFAIKKKYSKNAWILIFLTFSSIFLFMFLSFKFTSKMTSINKKNGIINTLNDLKIRYQINEVHDPEINSAINQFMTSL